MKLEGGSCSQAIETKLKLIEDPLLPSQLNRNTGQVTYDTNSLLQILVYSYSVRNETEAAMQTSNVFWFILFLEVGMNRISHVDSISPGNGKLISSGECNISTIFKVQFEKGRQK